MFGEHGAGCTSNTKDGNPFFGYDNKYNGLFHAVGMGGQGFMLGCGLGKMLCRILTDNKGKYDDVALEEFNPYRKFKKGEELLR